MIRIELVEAAFVEVMKYVFVLFLYAERRNI